MVIPALKLVFQPLGKTINFVCITYVAENILLLHIYFSVSNNWCCNIKEDETWISTPRKDNTIFDRVYVDRIIYYQIPSTWRPFLWLISEIVVSQWVKLAFEPLRKDNKNFLHCLRHSNYSFCCWQSFIALGSLSSK